MEVGKVNSIKSLRALGIIILGWKGLRYWQYSSLEGLLILVNQCGFQEFPHHGHDVYLLEALGGYLGGHDSRRIHA